MTSPAERSFRDSRGPAAAAQRWATVRATAEAALAQPPEARAALLDGACGGDAGLRAEVDAQVNACERAVESAAFLAEPAAAFAAPLFAPPFEGVRADEHARDCGPSAGATPGATAEPGAGMEATLRAALAGRYDVERELGRGGMATVYLARDRRHERRVALKVLDPALGATMSAERFLREIRVTAGLTHPHILPLHDSGEAAGLLYYVMPFVDGETLRQRLARERPLALDTALRLVREVASALACAHRQGVVHRDVKPANILLEDGHAVVADFGIARAVRRAREAEELDAARDAAHPREDHEAGTLTGAGPSPGTPAYMAPEQAGGDALIDHRADLYALGVIAYEALAGGHPFGARAPAAFMAAHRCEAPPPLAARRPDVPHALAALIMRLLAKDPAVRPPSAEAVLRVLDGAAVSPAGGARRWRAVVRATVAALLVAAGLGGYAAWRESPAFADGSTPEATRRSVGAPSRVAFHTVAVLPFVNTGGTAADDYFSDGLTDELAHALARLPGLRLAGRSSSYTYKGKAAAAQEVGRALNVGALLGGTVRRSGDRLRVSAQLVSTADGKVLWASVFESRSGDVFSVQDELTRAIVAAVAPAISDGAAGTSGAIAGRGTTDAEAYDLYLKGRYHWLERGPANVRLAIVYFRRAVARDPAFARAHAGLALAYGVLPVYVPDPTDSATALLEASARRAVALDTTLADAQIALGLALELRRRYGDAEARYRTALALEPSNVTAHHWLGWMLLSIGRTEEAVTELRRATVLDPLAKSAGAAAAAALIFARRFPEAEAASRRVLALDATFPLAIRSLGLAQAFGGQPDSAVRTLERGMLLHPDSPGQHSALLFAYAAAGRWADAERARTRLRRPGGDLSGGAEAAFAELVFGNREPLVRLLMTGSGQHSWSDALIGFGCNPLIDPLWADARFRAAMRGLTVEPCPLARPWPVPRRPGT